LIRGFEEIAGALDQCWIRQKLNARNGLARVDPVIHCLVEEERSQRREKDILVRVVNVHGIDPLFGEMKSI
jgi:hypothetical protein